MTAAFTLCCWGGSVLSSRLARETWSIWENTGELTGTGEPYSPAHTHSQADRIRCSWIQECLAVCAQPPARAALISFGAIRSDCNTNEWYTGKAQMWAVKQLGMGAEQAPELLQGTWGGWAGFVHWDHPAPPCFQGCWCHPAAWWQLMLCASSPSSVQLPKAVPKGTAANQRVQHTDPAHTALAGAHLQPSSRGEGLLGGCTGALVHTRPHPAPAGSALLLSSSSTHPWLLAEMFLFPSAPTGCNPA